MTILVHATHAYGHKSYASREITTGRFEPLDLLCGDRRGEKCHPGGRPASVPEACEQVREAVSIGHSQIAVPGRCRQEQTMERGLKWGIRFPDKGEIGGSSPPRPTFNSPIYTRRFSLSPSRELVIKKPFCQNFAKSSSRP